MQKVTRVFLAATLLSLAASPAAHARWITGNGNPPVSTDDNPCRNGMGWSYATFVPGSWPSGTLPRELRAHVVVIDHGGTPPFPPPGLDVMAWAPTRTIPQRWRQIPGTGIAPALFAPIPA